MYYTFSEYADLKNVRPPPAESISKKSKKRLRIFRAQRSFKAVIINQERTQTLHIDSTM